MRPAINNYLGRENVVMKRSLLTGLGLTLVSSLFDLSAAPTAATRASACRVTSTARLPRAGGKADGWDSKNDPRYFASHLEYKLASLPKKGKLTTPVWKDKYPEAVGKAAVAVGRHVLADLGRLAQRALAGHRPSKSPLEKYDAAFNNAAGLRDAAARCTAPARRRSGTRTTTCAGPAAKWQSDNFQGGGKMHDGIDNDGDGKIDEYGADGIDGVQGWWGTCHAWTPASLMSPEPQHAVTMNGVTFEVGDIKALMQNIFDKTSAVMLGGRCNNKEITHDVTRLGERRLRRRQPGRAARHPDELPRPAARRRSSRTARRTTKCGTSRSSRTRSRSRRRSPRRAANKCVGATGSTWKYNTTAKDLYEVKATVTYITETYPGRRRSASRTARRRTTTTTSSSSTATGKVIGGRYCTDTRTPTSTSCGRRPARCSPSNPNVDVTKVKAAHQGLGRAGRRRRWRRHGTTKDFSATPATAIPDNNPTGVSVDVPVTGVDGAKGLAVSVDITHTYRGDLVVTLLKDGTAVKTLSQDEGGPRTTSSRPTR